MAELTDRPAIFSVSLCILHNSVVCDDIVSYCHCLSSMYMGDCFSISMPLKQGLLWNFVKPF